MSKLPWFWLRPNDCSFCVSFIFGQKKGNKLRGELVCDVAQAFGLRSLQGRVLWAGPSGSYINVDECAYVLIYHQVVLSKLSWFCLESSRCNPFVWVLSFDQKKGAFEGVEMLTRWKMSFLGCRCLLLRKYFMARSLYTGHSMLFFPYGYWSHNASFLIFCFDGQLLHSWHLC